MTTRQESPRGRGTKQSTSRLSMLALCTCSCSPKTKHSLACPANESLMLPSSSSRWMDGYQCSSQTPFELIYRHTDTHRRSWITCRLCKPTHSNTDMKMDLTSLSLDDCYTGFGVWGLGFGVWGLGFG